MSLRQNGFVLDFLNKLNVTDVVDYAVAVSPNGKYIGWVVASRYEGTIANRWDLSQPQPVKGANPLFRQLELNETVIDNSARIIPYSVTDFTRSFIYSAILMNRTSSRYTLRLSAVDMLNVYSILLPYFDGAVIVDYDIKLTPGLLSELMVAILWSNYQVTLSRYSGIGDTAIVVGPVVLWALPNRSLPMEKPKVSFSTKADSNTVCLKYHTSDVSIKQNFTIYCMDASVQNITGQVQVLFEALTQFDNSELLWNGYGDLCFFASSIKQVIYHCTELVYNFGSLAPQPMNSSALRVRFNSSVQTVKLVTRETVTCLYMTEPFPTSGIANSLTLRVFCHDDSEKVNNAYYDSPDGANISIPAYFPMSSITAEILFVGSSYAFPSFL